MQVKAFMDKLNVGQNNKLIDYQKFLKSEPVKVKIYQNKSQIK